MKEKIRKATKKDKEILTDLRYKLHKYESNIEKSDKFNKKAKIKDKKNIIHDLSDKNVFLFLGYYGKIPVGYSKIKIKKINNEVMGHIGADFVLKKFRGLGIGKKLVQAMLNVLKKKRIKEASVEMYKTNKLSIKVHKKLGFKIVDKRGKLYRMEKKVK